MQQEGVNQQPKNIFLIFLYWWYIEAPKGLLIVYKNLLFITFDYFSIFILIKTFFKPWKKIYTPKGRGLPGVVKSWQDNAISRLVGMSVRTIFIILALISLTVVLVSEILFFIFWLTLPFLSLYSFFLSIKTLFIN